MGIAYFTILGYNLLIAVDTFSTAVRAVKPGSLTVLNEEFWQKQLYEALGGRDFEKVNALMEGVITDDPYVH